MALDEFLEKIVADGYKREIDREENVARTLPFFATSLAVLATMIGFIRASIPTPSLSPFSIFIWAAMTSMAVEVMLVVWSLREAVRKRSFQYVLGENDLNNYVEGLRNFYQYSGLTDDEQDDAIVEDVREELIKQYTRCAVNNRTNNFAREEARANALTRLAEGLFFAFVLIGAILAHDGMERIIYGGTVQGEDRGGTQAPDGDRRDGSRAPEAVPASGADSRQRRVDVPGGPAASIPAEPPRTLKRGERDEQYPCAICSYFSATILAACGSG